MKLQNAVSEIISWRLNTSLYEMWQAVALAECDISTYVSYDSLTVRSCVCWMNESTKIGQCFSLFFSVVALLHVTRKILKNGFNNDLLDILATLLGSNVSCLRITELNTSELIELLQKSAVERMTTYRQLVASDVGSVATIVTTDFEALYAYKHGDYQRCLQLSTQNVHTLLYAHRMQNVPTFPEFIQLLDDDIVSLTALTLIANPKCRDNVRVVFIGQLTLSLYLMTQSQLKLHHSVTSLAQTLDYIKVAQRRHPPNHTCDMLTLKLIERKAIGHNEEPGTKLFSCTYNRPGSVHLPKTWTQTSPCLV